MTNTTTLTIGQNQYNTKQIGDHFFAEIPVKVFCELPPAPIQRNSHLRVNKMRSIFDLAYLANQSSTLTEVAIGIVVEDFDDIDYKTGNTISSYKKGEISIIDGATRMYYWKTYPKQADLLKKNLTAKLHFLRNMNDVKFAYYPYNNKSSTEKTNELLQGLARRYNWQPRQPMFINGNYKTAIDWATSRPDDDRTFEPEVGFNFNFEELKILDNTPKGSGYTISKPALPKIKSQPIVAALLIAVKMYPNNIRLFDFIEQLVNITSADLHQAMANKQITPVEVIALEWQGWSAQRGTNTDTTWLNGIAGNTNYASKEPQLDFLLYWIIEYIQNPACKNDFHRGIRPSSWEGTWKEIFANEE